MTLKMYGESGDVDEASIQAAILSLQTRIEGFEAQNTWNADKFGLFNRLAPTSTVATHRLSCRIKLKDHSTVLVVASMDGVENVYWFFTGSSQQPRAFKKKNLPHYGLDYVTNNKAWMTNNLFHH